MVRQFRRVAVPAAVGILALSGILVFAPALCVASETAGGDVSLAGQVAKAQAAADEAALEAVLKDVHVGHLVEPEELASTIKHVITNDSIDGTTIEVTGGLVYGPRARAK